MTLTPAEVRAINLIEVRRLFKRNHARCVCYRGSCSPRSPGQRPPPRPPQVLKEAAEEAGAGVTGPPENAKSWFARARARTRRRASSRSRSRSRAHRLAGAHARLTNRRRSEDAIRAYFASGGAAKPTPAPKQPRLPPPDEATFARWFPGLPLSRTARAPPRARVLCFANAGNAEDMYTSEGTGPRRAPSPLLVRARERARARACTPLVVF